MTTCSPNDLPNDIDALKAMLILRDEQLHSAHEEIATQAHQIRFLEEYSASLEEQQRLEKARKFAAKSEKNKYQLSLFDEAESTAQQAELESNLVEDKSDEVTVKSHTKRKARKPLPRHLPTEEIIYTLDEQQRQCECGCQLTCIGENKKEQVDIIPMQLKRIVHIQKKYVCRQCNSAPIVAPKPKQPIAKSPASPGFLAFITTAKYVDGLPLYRLSKMFERQQIDIGRHTLANYMVQMGSRVITPLLDAINAHIKGYDIVHMDETPVQVLKEPGRRAQNKSYMWVMKGGPPHQSAVMYHYAPSRSQDIPLALLSDYQGYLQTDGYVGYNSVLKMDGVTGMGCFAHARRKFIDAEKALPKKLKKSNSVAAQFIKLIKKLYKLERELQSVPAHQRHNGRQDGALPILEKLHALAMQYKDQVPPNSLLGKAISYLLSQWERLVVYCDDGRLNIDNNPIENAIRPFVIGRKNWLFSQSQAGANASAGLYTLVETAKANDLNPYDYLRLVYTELPNVKSQADIEALLPWNVDKTTYSV